MACAGRRTDARRAQRLCERYNQPAVGDQNHIIFERPALQCVRESMLQLFEHSACSKQSFLAVDWNGVAHTFEDSLSVLDAPVANCTIHHIHSLGGWNRYNHYFLAALLPSGEKLLVERLGWARRTY